MPRGWLVFPMTRVEHIDPGQMAAYLENACTAEERARVESHLAECTGCCEELAALDETVRTLPSRRRRWRVVPVVGLAAAAVLAGLLVFGPSVDPEIDPGESRIVQRSLPEGRIAVAVEEPATNAGVAATGIVLRWVSVEPEARYQVVVTTAEGDSVWATRTSDSTTAIPIALEPGREYLWYVDALLADGGIASSGIHRFQVVQ